MYQTGEFDHELPSTQDQEKTRFICVSRGSRMAIGATQMRKRYRHLRTGIGGDRKLICDMGGGELPGQDSNLDKENQNLLNNPPKANAGKACGDSRSAVDRALTKAEEIDHDFARVVEAWPTLPAAIREAVLKLIS
jgi:hypothetical protein